MPPKDSDGIKNTEDHNQNAYLRPVWSGSAVFVIIRKSFTTFNFCHCPLVNRLSSDYRSLIEIVLQGEIS